MEEGNVFQSALSSFATEAACGGAIRHLTDIGCTLEQIVARLDYPTSREKAQRIMMAYLYESRVLLRKEPSDELFGKKTQFVQEQDAYGRRTLRKTTIDYNSQHKMTYVTQPTELSKQEKTAEIKDLPWRESVYDPGRDGKLTELLHRKCEENGTAYSYMSCDHTLFHGESQGDFHADPTGQMKGEGENALSCLNNRQREYLAGIRWESPALYHRLDQRMLEIIGKLYEAGVYSGVCFFALRREKTVINRQPYNRQS